MRRSSDTRSAGDRSSTDDASDGTSRKMISRGFDGCGSRAEGDAEPPALTGLEVVFCIIDLPSTLRELATTGSF
jgi:hypothetical protein